MPPPCAGKAQGTAMQKPLSPFGNTRQYSSSSRTPRVWALHEDETTGTPHGRMTVLCNVMIASSQKKAECLKHGLKASCLFVVVPDMVCILAGTCRSKGEVGM